MNVHNKFGDFFKLDVPDYHSAQLCCVLNKMVEELAQANATTTVIGFKPLYLLNKVTVPVLKLPTENFILGKNRHN